MSVKAITAAKLTTAQNKNNNRNTGNKNSNPSFQGLASVPVAVADAINNGGFAFSFIAQDGFGMAFPRVLEGINRRPVNPETGKKEGPYNWAFARREGIREILSGPSAFIIPAFILKFVKKYSGQANNVPVNMIQGLGKNFIAYAAKSGVNLEDVAKTREEFYEQVFKNVLHTTLEGNVKGEELDNLAHSFMQRAIEIEQAKDNKKSLWAKITNKSVAGSPEDLTESLLDDFMALKKKHLPASVNELSAELTVNPEKIGKYGEQILISDKDGVGFKKLLKTMTDFTDDVIETTGKALNKAKDGFNAEEFLNSFVKRRTGSRIITNLGMWSAVVGFYALIPKLYSLGLKGKNPAFIHEQQAAEKAEDSAKKGTTEKAEDSAKPESTANTTTNNTSAVKQNEEAGKDKDKQGTTENKKDVSFSGREKLFEQAADRVIGSSKLSKFLSNFEFNDASMSVPAMLALLFGFCLPTRLANAPDKYDVKETLARDITSFSAILFAANAISRAFSNAFSKISGLALIVKPSNHEASYWNKFKNYFSPMGGINVLDNKQLASKYTNVHLYKDGINGFFDFISENGGNIKKLLKMDKDVAAQAKIILGKEIDAASVDEIKNAFKNIATEEAQNAKKAIEDIFKNNKNKFVQRAKLYNSMFTCLSTIALVPAFMIWLARKCDKMTRDARARDLAEAAKTEPATKDNKQEAPKVETANKVEAPKQENQAALQQVAKMATQKPTMAGFVKG